MMPYRIIAIPTEIAEQARATGRDPRYSHPAYIEVASGYGPCRHCLRAFDVGSDRRVLFTYDSFHGIEPQPLPGPIYIHEGQCTRYGKDVAYPRELSRLPQTFYGYAHGRQLITQRRADRNIHGIILEIFDDSRIAYIQVHNAEEGCYLLRIDRA